MRKVTYEASPDVALIKYWGKKNEELRLPENGSISIVLDGLKTTTSVEFNAHLRKDEICIEDSFDKKEIYRVTKHLDLIRKLARKKYYAKVVSRNSFPKATGLSSSGSAFAALTMAACKALGMQLAERELSIIARQGSGTACRCVCGGFVEWKDGESSETSYAKTIFPADWWDIRDVIAVVNEGQKKVLSSEGHRTARTSLFYKERLRDIKKKIGEVKKAIKVKNFRKLGELAEAEALEFHSILLTSQPALIAWYPGTLEVMHEVRRLREVGMEAYFTVSTGFNVHVLTQAKYEKAVKENIEKLSLIRKVLLAEVGSGPKEISKHLF